jgi:ubiquinone/menaquinone biosynthesis C-methylase UbiE
VTTPTRTVRNTVSSDTANPADPASFALSANLHGEPIEPMRRTDPTQRFSSRVENYIRYRPGYPFEVLELLRIECGLTPDSVIADIASGTGILTRMLLENGNRVFGVEPNPEMRQAGEQFLAPYPGFTSVAGNAEATTLDDHSVDIVTAAQAAHWFDREKSRREFVRVLVPGGWTVLLWNERDTDSTPFLREYEQLLLTYGTDYQEVRHERTTDAIDTFFGPSPFQSKVFQHSQEFNAQALEGRLLSSSYTPQPEDASYESMLRELRRIFDRHQRTERVSFEYTTRVYYGQLE